MSTINGIVEIRRDTAANMSSVVLLSGEPGYATDTKIMKIGDGVTTFASLAEIVTTPAIVPWNGCTGHVYSLELRSYSTHTVPSTLYIDTAPRG